MKILYPELQSLIAEMADGDSEFESQLTTAIHQGLVELREKYLEGSNTKNELTIQQIRHKLKPTLEMFEFSDIISELGNGKQILESNGFDSAFESHKAILLIKLDAAIAESLHLIK